MARIVLEVSTPAPPVELARALTTREGIGAWWTDDVEFAGGAGEGATMRLGFPVAPVPFELRIESASESAVTWRSVGAFPPHWVDTTVTWTITPAEGGTTLHLSHDGWASDEGPLPGSAYTWARLLGTLTEHAETGAMVPLFTRAG